MEEKNFLELIAATGSLSIKTEVTYGDYYLAAHVEVTGQGYNVAKIAFSCSAGSFGPKGPIYLTPQNLTAENLDYSCGHMKLHINSIDLDLATPEQDAVLFLNCSFTDIHGEGSQDYNGQIAKWTGDGKEVPVLQRQ